VGKQKPKQILFFRTNSSDVMCKHGSHNSFWSLCKWLFYRNVHNLWDKLCTGLKNLEDRMNISLLGCDTVRLGRQVPAFHWNQEEGDGRFISTKLHSFVSHTIRPITLALALWTLQNPLLHNIPRNTLDM
jgi:hypothetical protein